MIPTLSGVNTPDDKKIELIVEGSLRRVYKLSLQVWAGGVLIQ